MEYEREVQALKEHGGNQAAAARSLEMPVSTFKGRIARSNSNLEEVPLGFKTKGYSEFRRTETGGIWQKVEVDKAQLEDKFRAFCEEAARPLKGLAPYVPPPALSDDRLLALYPIGDQHHGMKADPEETGEAYDCKISSTALMDAIGYLSSKVPPAKDALLLNLGDFFHANDSSNETPASRNKMDVDTRFGQVFDSGAMTLVKCILRLLERHERVFVWSMRGNHDPDAACALAVALAFYFWDEPRVIVDRGTSLYKFMRHGKTLIASHHGHGAKQADLPLLMAVDRKEDWAATDHRVWHLGHFHHKKMQEYPGADVEIHRTLAGTDAWHAGKGYRSKRDMQAIIYHDELGEVVRHRFDAALLAAQCS